MKELRFGIEIETIGQSRQRVARAIQSVVGGTIHHVARPLCYDPWEVHAPDGRVWKVMADSSLSAPKHLQAEVVSPILRYEDIPTLQNIIRAIRKQAKAKVDSSCGIHVHVDAASFDAKALTRLVKIFNKQQRLIMAALGVTERRQRRWCKPIDPTFLRRLEAERPATLEAFNAIWYGRFNPSPAHYDSTRYAALNLHNVWYRGTIELRAFEATLHAGKVKASIQLTLALAHMALTAKRASSKPRPFNPDTARYDFRCFLLRLGLIGPEFKTARLHLLARLEGSAAWKHGRPQQQQQQRMAA